MTPVVELDNLVKSYGPTPALGPLTLSVPEGTTGLLGPNGAGKTTLVRVLLGLLRPTAGSVRILGEDVTPGAKSLRRRIGYAPEGEALFPTLRGVEAVALAGRLVGMRAADALQRAHQVLDYVGLGEARYRAAAKFSAGMRQRLKLAQALVHDPEFLILDEPTEDVDPQGRLDILNLIQELSREYGIHVLLSTHLLHDVERLAKYAVVLNEGRAVATGTIEELKAPQKRGFFLRVDGPIEPLARLLDAQKIPWQPMAPNVKIDLADPMRILKLVAEAGLVVRHLAPAELSLNEAFVAAVGGGRGA